MGRFHKEVILKGPKGERKVDLLVDTGAVTSMINKKIAEELGLPIIGKAKLYGLNEKLIEEDVVGANIIIDGCSSHIAIASSKQKANILGADAMQQLDAKVEPKIHKITVRKCEPYQINNLRKKQDVNSI